VTGQLDLKPLWYKQGLHAAHNSLSQDGNDQTPLQFYNVQLEMLLETADFHDSRFLTVSCFCDNMSNDEYCRGKSAGQYFESHSN
jgi:hypothetical protein